MVFKLNLFFIIIQDITNRIMEKILTKGCLKSMIKNEEVSYPIMQVLGVRKITAPGREERYRLLISDSENVYSYVMLATQLNNMITSDELTIFAILRIKHHLNSTLADCPEGIQVLIIMDFDVLVPGNNLKKIGNPIPIIPNLDKLVGVGSSAIVVPLPQPQLLGKHYNNTLLHLCIIILNIIIV